MSKRQTLAALSLLLLFGVALRSIDLTARSLWFDEAFSWRLLQFPLEEMIARDAQDVHPPLYYIVLKGWSLVFGSSLLSLRSFSVTAAAATVAAAYLFISYAKLSRSTGLLAATLITLSSWQIQFGREARMYTLGTTLALLSTWALLRAVRFEPQKIRWWLAYALLSTLFAYVHYYAFFTIFAHAVFVLAYIVTESRGRLGEMLAGRRLWYALLAVFISVALYLPWISTFIRQITRVQSSYWIGPVTALSIPATLYRMFIPSTGQMQPVSLSWHIIILSPIFITVIIGFIFRRGRLDRSQHHDVTWLIILLVAIPFILSSLQSLVSQSVYQDRFFVFTHIFLIIYLATLASNIVWAPLRRTIMLSLIFSFAAGSILNWNNQTIKAKPGSRGATQHIFANRQIDEPVIVSSPFIYFAILYYSQAEFKTPNLPKLYSETGELSHFAGGPILTPQDFVGPKIFQTQSPALWVVDTSGFGESRLKVPSAWHIKTSHVYPEVFAYQGDVIITKYIKQ